MSEHDLARSSHAISIDSTVLCVLVSNEENLLEQDPRTTGIEDIKKGVIGKELLAAVPQPRQPEPSAVLPNQP